MGWAYNTDDDAPNRGLAISVIAIVFSSASLFAVLCRAYVRFVLLKFVGPETKWGLGLENIEHMPAEDVYNFGLVQYIGSPFYIIAILGFKLSLLISYLRIIPGRGWRITIICVGVACTMFHTTFLLVQLFLCTPIAKQWDKTIEEGSCVTAVPFYTSMASLTILFDLLVMFLPFPTLYRSRIQKRRKAVLLGLFATGLFITVTQILRIQTIKQLTSYLNSAPVTLWSNIEANLGIIVTCVPTLAPLVKYFAERTSRSSGGATGTTGANGGGTGGRKTGGARSASYGLQSLPGGGGGNTAAGRKNNNYNESQESMIPRQEEQPEGVIVKKTEVHMLHLLVRSE
ncbi:hypothetical protein PG985_009893 [Apiospora marii]|uniref:uncharacterized protein n=1 Tax=Apiospora marii TaxID=335849 RepID=UPI00313237FB